MPALSTLVVGGEHSFVLDKLTPQLRRYGLSVDAHWEWRRLPGAFPARTEVVFLLTDMMGHTLYDRAKKDATSRNVPVVLGVRKWAINAARLEKAGFQEVAETVTPPPPPQEEPVSYSKNIEQAPLYQLYEQIVVDTPDITNAAAYEEAKKRGAATGLDVGKDRSDLLAMIRRNLGVSLPRGPKALPALGFARVEAEVVAVAPEAVRAAVRRADYVARSVKRLATVAAKKAALGATEPLFSFEDAAIVVAPDPVPTAHDALRDAVGRVRAAMLAVGLTHLTVTPESVTYKKMVVVEGSFDF